VSHLPFLQPLAPPPPSNHIDEDEEEENIASLYPFAKIKVEDLKLGQVSDLLSEYRKLVIENYNLKKALVQSDISQEFAFPNNSI
jgi:hypothetical protein